MVENAPAGGDGGVELRMLTAVDVHDWVSALSAAAFAAGVAGALAAHLLPAVKGRAPVE